MTEACHYTFGKSNNTLNDVTVLNLVTNATSKRHLTKMSSPSKRTPSKVRARRDRMSEYFSAMQEPPVRDSSGYSALKYSPSGRHVNISTINLLYENPQIAVFDKGEQREPCAQFRDATISQSNTGGPSGKRRSRDFSDFLYSLWKDKRMCDITLKVEGKEISAHKIALAAYSDKFTTKYCEDAPTTVSEIILSNGSAEAVEILLDYIYTSELHVNIRNIESILVCARQLGITSAVKICEDRISAFDKDNVLALFNIAERQGLTEISSRMHQFICENFIEMSRSTAFLQACAEHVRWILSKDELCIKSELDVFFAVLSWIEYNRQERLRFAVDLLQCVRFVYISPEDLVTHVEPVRHLFDIHECKQMLYEAFR